MDRIEIMATIRNLSFSQGFYGRILERLSELDAETFDAVMTELEGKHFQDAVDLVLFFEC